MKIHYLQHVAFENPGYILSWMQDMEHQITCTLFYESSYQLPSLYDIDALIIMGGPMSADDEAEYPWLCDEKNFIKHCIKAGKKVLGICLGAQLIAECLGAQARPAAQKEIGWFPVMPAEKCKKLPWFYDLFKNKPMVFHWHGEMFDIPDGGSLNLLSSEANNNQAFHKNNMMGLQFHLEITPQTMDQILENGAHELKQGPYIQNVKQIKSGFSHIENCNHMMKTILERWLA